MGGNALVLLKNSKLSWAMSLAMALAWFTLTENRPVQDGKLFWFRPALRRKGCGFSLVHGVGPVWLRFRARAPDGVKADMVSSVSILLPQRH